MTTLRTAMAAATLALLAACEPAGPIMGGILADDGGSPDSPAPSLYDRAAGPFTPDAYGPGVGMDRYGRAVRHDPFMDLTPNAYGLGVGKDQYGRPVYHGL